ncbi:MAG: tRNA 2-thiouridine(34) synthase MnmA [Nitrososphaerales archaeon]
MLKPEGRRVVVAMSGGVDSSVAAALLVEQGYEVIGIMLRLWSEPPKPVLGGQVEAPTNRCCSAESVHDAASVADRLGIPFYAINAEAPFKQRVVDAWIEGYADGLTPNPCLNCNRYIRFGYLLDYARSLGATHLATGHYVRLRRSSDGCMELWRGLDRAKDQSYVLSVLGQADLASALFPVGEYTKPQVRALAAERGLPTASRVDSQDLCFVGDGDYRRFLSEHAPEAARPGPILDTGDRQLGEHRGLPFYTIGQRSGLGIAAACPLYVLRLDMKRNALIVGRAEELGSMAFRTGPVNWLAGTPPGERFKAEVQIRYRAQAVAATVSVLPDGGAAVEVKMPLRDVTPGQAAAFYSGERCLGHGLILR